MNNDNGYKAIGFDWINWGALFILFFPLFKPLVYQWIDYADDSHGFLIIPVSSYLIWQKRHELKTKAYTANPVFLIFLLISLIGYLAFFIGDIIFFARICMLLVFFSYILVIFGYQRFRFSIFPLCYLFFMIPLPATLMQPISLPLRLFVSKISVMIAQLLGIVIFREGNIISLPNGTLEVAAACSGLRSLVSLIALSAILAYLIQDRKWKWIICFLSAIPVAILANIFRVFSSILMFKYISTSTVEGM